MFRTVRCGVLAIMAVTLVLLFASAAFAQSKVSIAIVDMSKIKTDYDGYKQADFRFQKLIEQRTNTLQALQDGLFLGKDDFANYQKMVLNGVPQEDAIAALAKTSKANEAEYTALTDKLKDKTPLTDTESARQAELEGYARANSAVLNNLYTTYQQELDNVQKGQDTVLMTAINDTLTKMAKAKKYDLVLNKATQAGQGAAALVLFCGNNLDITLDVLAELNRSFKDEMLDKLPAPTPEPNVQNMQ